MNYQDLNKLVKFCSNRISYSEFESMMMLKYNDSNYISNLWELFVKNPLLFITARNEEFLFDEIQKTMENMDYKG